MQLRLTSEQLNLIANLLMEHGEKTHAHEVLLRMILAKDLAFDSEQLAFLEEFLKTVQHNLRHSMEHHGDAVENPALAETLATLEGTVEKVEEACAML